MPQQSTFIIDREDRAVDPITLVTEGLSIGRLPDCELVLNHPTVSRLHAGIKEVNGRFYVFHLSPSNSTTLNGNLVEERSALAEGDVLQVGPFFIYVGGTAPALNLRVIYQTAVRIGDATVQLEPGALSATNQPAPGAVATMFEQPGRVREEQSVDEALDVFWDKRKREAGKIMRPSPLRPQTPPRLGKARFNWTPTRDLVRPWPFTIFIWAVLAVSVLAVGAAFAYSSAYSPAPVSNAHARRALTLTPAIARQPNANACTTCHVVKTDMNQQCAGCHQTDAFKATVTPPHAAAGITCTTCHNEHRGADFRPGLAPMNVSFQAGVEPGATCAGCHNDANKKLYNGRRVFTPHGGTFGYPVEPDGTWHWQGLAAAELEHKAPEVKQLLAAWPAQNDNTRRSAQFHALHLHRIRAIGGLPGNAAGELSCSSCHKSWGATLDRETPRQTCAICHNGYVDPVTQRAVIAASQPNCNSCHVQHVADTRHWNPELLVNPPQTAQAQPPPTAAGKE